MRPNKMETLSKKKLSIDAPVRLPSYKEHLDKIREHVKRLDRDHQNDKRL